MEFPPVKFINEISARRQWEHLRSEFFEVQMAIYELQGAAGPEKFDCAMRVVEELADVRHSAETLARRIQKDYPDIDLDLVDAVIIAKNTKRGYYTERRADK